MHVDNVDLEKPEAGMTLEELWVKFHHMIRHASQEQKQAIEASGPLSDDHKYIRPRQEFYRRIIARQSGVILSEKPDGLMHHPV